VGKWVECLVDRQVKVRRRTVAVLVLVFDDVVKGHRVVEVEADCQNRCVACRQVKSTEADRRTWAWKDVLVVVGRKSMLGAA